MIITCPHCETRYQVAEQAIGARGRQVQCANCGKGWAASAVREPRLPVLVSPPPADSPIMEHEEAQLDTHFSWQEAVAFELQPGPGQQTAPAEPPSSLDPALLRKRQRAFSKRQTSLTRKLPLARFRRGARVAAVLLLLGVLGGGYFFRVEAVRQFPALAEVYAGLGLPVNVVGLELREVSTVRAIRAGETVLNVNFTVAASSGRRAAVPPVIVTLLDAHGASLYEWSVTPVAQELLPGETVEASTQLTAAPPGATRLRLSFGSTRAPAPESPGAVATEVPGKPAHQAPAEGAHGGDPHAAEAHG